MKTFSIIITFITLFLITSEGHNLSSAGYTHQFLQITSKEIDRDSNTEPTPIVHIVSQDNSKISDQKVGSFLRKKIWNYSNGWMSSNASNFYRQLIDNEKLNLSRICDVNECQNK